MTYRNDHDAALARIDALQSEVDRLRTPGAAPPPSPPATERGRFGLAANLVVGTAAVLGLVGVALGHASDPTPNERVARLDVRLSRTELSACAADIMATPSDIPRSGVLTPTHVYAIEHSATPCDLRAFRAGSMWSPEERNALDAWITAEDSLSNVISMISVYYSESPETVDRYASAQQLWREYSRARLVRDAAMAHWFSTE